jgi:hypothetical protein
MNIRRREWHGARLLLTAAFSALAASAVWAQEAALPQLAPIPTPSIGDGGVELDVARRHRSEFDPSGISLGSWTLFPAVATHLGYETNLYGAENNEKSDGYGEVEPSATLQSNFSGGAVTFQADGRFKRFFDQSAADETSYDAAVDGRYDISNSASLYSGAAFGQLIERRDSSGFPDGLVEPIRFLRTNAYVRAQYEAGNFRTLASLDYTRFDFRDATTINPDGTTTHFSQKVRDQHIGRASISADYALTPDFGFFLQGVASTIHYSRAEIAPGIPNLSAKDYTALAGVTLGTGQLVRGSVGVGYNWRTYAAGSLGHLGGLAFKADLKYFATPLVTISLTASRTLEQAIIQNAVAGQLVVEKADGLVSSVGTIRADYELLRSLILNASVTYSYANFRNDPRRDTVIEADAGATYHMNRRLALDLGASYVNRKVKGDPEGASYDDFTLAIGLQLSL